MPSSRDYLDATREHLTAAESYARISQEADRLRQQTPALSGGEAISQAIGHLYGDSAGGVSEQIARAADQMRAFHAAQEFMQAQNAFRNTGLRGIGSFDSGNSKPIRGLCATRNYFGHPEQVWTPLSDADILKAAKDSLGEISGTLKTLQRKLDDPSSSLNKQQRTALSESIEHLKHMQADLVQMRSGPTPPSGLSMSDVEGATHLEEIRAGRNAKAAMHSGGADLKSDKTLQVLSNRGNDLAHLDPKPEHPGALERVRNGAGLSSQLPRQAQDIGRFPANGHDRAPPPQAGAQSPAPAVNGSGTHPAAAAPPPPAPSVPAQGSAPAEPPANGSTPTPPPHSPCAPDGVPPEAGHLPAAAELPRGTGFGGLAEGALRVLPAGPIVAALDAAARYKEGQQKMDAVLRAHPDLKLSEEAQAAYRGMFATARTEQGLTMGVSQGIGLAQFNAWAQKYHVDPSYWQALNPTSIELSPDTGKPVGPLASLAPDLAAKVNGLCTGGEHCSTDPLRLAAATTPVVASRGPGLKVGLT